MEAKKEKISIFGIYKRLLKRINVKDKSIYLHFIIYTISATIFPLSLVLLPKFIIDNLQQQEPFEKILYGLIIFVVINSFFGFFSVLSQRMGYFKCMRIRIDFLANLAEKIINLEYHYCEQPDFQDKLNTVWRGVSSNDTGLESLYHKAFTLFSLILSIIFYIYLISSLSYLVLIAIIASVIVTFFITKYIRTLFYKHKDEISHSARRMEYYQNTSQDFSFGKDIRLFNLKDKILSRYDIFIGSYISVIKKIYNKEYLIGIIELIFVLIKDGLTYGLLIYKLINNQISIGDFTMYLGATLVLSTTLTTIVNDLSHIYGESMYVSDYFIYLEKNFNQDKGTLNAIENDTLEIEFKNVSFKYPNTEKYIFKNLNFKINKGEKIAIVGVNGAGKTTLIKLLTRLFDVDEGEIYVNGININDFKLQEYYKMFSVVFQNVNVLAYTVRENIAISNDPEYDENIWSVLDRVGLKEKIASYEKGLNQIMLKIIDEGGVELSGGENQKLAIARALYKNANMVIMDEPTAALDALAEEAIYRNFNDLVENKTAIYISHRLSSTKFCDRIILLSEDGILEEGSHDELMNLKGEYYHMFVTQGKYYQDNTLEEGALYA